MDDFQFTARIILRESSNLCLLENKRSRRINRQNQSKAGNVDLQFKLQNEKRFYFYSYRNISVFIIWNNSFVKSFVLCSCSPVFTSMYLLNYCFRRYVWWPRCCVSTFIYVITYWHEMLLFVERLRLNWFFENIISKK